MGGADEGAMTPAANGQAEAEKARWEARKAQLEAEQTARENAEWDSEEARRQRAAEQASATARAEQETAEARQKQLTSLLPNLSSVDRGETRVSGEQPIYGQALARRALERAASKIASAVKAALGSEISVLVTSDPDLAASDAAYLEVVTGLEQLTAAADRVLTPPAQEAAVPAAIGAVAAAIPSVLSLLSAHRSITTTSGPTDDLSAAASVAGALLREDPGAEVWHDGFRTLSRDSKIYQALGWLRERRRALAVYAQLAGSYGTAKDELAEHAEPVIAAIDQFVASVTAVPPDARRSMLASAALREGLHDGTVRYVLLVTGNSSSSSQLIDDRPLMWKDAFCVVAASSVSYLLVQASDGRVVVGGTGSGTFTVRGKINSRIVVEQAD